MKKLFKIFFPLVVFSLSFGVYAWTLAPSLSAGDSTEMVSIALSLGIAHPQSYPFVAVIGHVFSLLPFGFNPIWRVNLMSAFFQALANMVVYFIILELFEIFKNSFGDGFWRGLSPASIRKGPLAAVRQQVDLTAPPVANFLAASASLFLGFTLEFWRQAIKAEVFSLNNFLSSLIILTALIYRKERKKIWFYLLVFLTGLAFSHHQTAILVLPAVIYFIWPECKDFLFKKKTMILVLLVFITGLTPYFITIINLAKNDPGLNWGNPSNFTGALRTLARSDFGSFAYLKEADKGQKDSVLDQFVYYFSSIAEDFTLWGVVLALLGGVYLWRQNKRIFIFLIIGLATGLLFFGYAQFSLSGAFALATLKRFQLLPGIFVGGFLAFGLYFLWQKLLSQKLDPGEFYDKFALLVVFFLLSAVFAIPLLANFQKADNRSNWGTLRYCQDFYQATEPNAIIMTAGDVSGFCGQYEKYIELNKDDRIIFSPGQFHLKWFIPQLTERYPDLIIPPPLPGNRFAVTSQVIEANLGRRQIYVSPELAFHDPEVEKNYVLWPKNLLFLVGNKGGEKKLEPYQQESDRFWQSLDLDWFSWIKKNNPMFEDVIVGYYAQHFHNLGYMYDSVKLYDDAVREYQRALTIDPDFKESMKNLGLIYAFKMEPKDYHKAVGYLNGYLFLETDPELIDSTQYTIAKIYEDNQKELLKLQQEATESGERETDN